MKQLKQYLEELFVSPATTLGMGNVSFPSQENVPGGSGDIPNFCLKRRRKKDSKDKKFKE